MRYENLLHGIARFVLENEGMCPKVYKDSLGIPTIGVGFNLERNDAKYVLRDLGYDIEKVLTGEQEVEFRDILTIFAYNLHDAESTCAVSIPYWEELSYARKMAFVDMMFNLGYSRFRNFKKMLAALEEKDYDRAADEAKDSKWYDQVKSRGPRVVALIRKG